MLKFRLASHTVRQNTQVVEIWDDDQFIGQITPGDGKEIRVISKHPKKVVDAGDNLAVAIAFDLTRTLP